MRPDPAFEIRRDDLSGAPVRALLALHAAGMQANSPPDGMFALDLSGLQAPDVTVWTVWQADCCLGVGALRELGGGVAELKSMRTHPDHLRRGVAACLLRHMIAEARSRGLARLSLETGSGPAFAAGWSLYTRAGFVPGEAFGDYPTNGFNRFLHLAL